MEQVDELLPATCEECGAYPAEWRQWGDPDGQELAVLCQLCFEVATGSVSN